MTQKERIKKHLLSGWKITPLQALKKYGAFRLGAVIHTLKKEGMNISSKFVKVATRHGYSHVKQYWKNNGRMA